VKNTQKKIRGWIRDGKCPECGEGNLVKTCAFCGKAFEECTCSKEELDKRCHVCGASKEKCLCRNNNNNKINNF